jgi:hypothetical protein
VLRFETLEADSGYGRRGRSPPTFSFDLLRGAHISATLFNVNLWLLYLYICHTYASSSLCKFSTDQQNITVAVRTIHHSPSLTYYSIYEYLSTSCSSMTAVCVLNGAFGDVRNFGPTRAMSESWNTCLPCSESNMNATSYIGEQHMAHAFCTYLLCRHAKELHFHNVHRCLCERTHVNAG